MIVQTSRFGSVEVDADPEILRTQDGRRMEALAEYSLTNECRALLLRRYFGEERGTAMVATYTSPGVVIRIEPGESRAWDYAES
jgi:hypothetical protein